MESRLTEIETKVTYQDNTIEEMQQLLNEQQKQIDQLVLQVKRLSDRATAEGDSAVVDISLEAPPPHY